MGLEVEGATAAAEKLRDFGRQLPGLVKKSGLRAVAKTAKAQTVARLKTTKQDPDGQAWEPWSPTYALTRGPRHSLLQDTRKMTRTLKVRPKGPDLLMGSDRTYGPFVQERREFVGVGREDVGDLQSTLDDWVMGEAKRHGVA